MSELRASRAPETESLTATTHSTASGGPSCPNMEPPTATTIPPNEYSLQYLIALVKKLDERRQLKTKQVKDGAL